MAVFSIPNGMNAGSGTSNSEAAPFEQASSDQRVEEVIELINEIVLEDIVVTDTVKEGLFPSDCIYSHSPSIHPRNPHS